MRSFINLFILVSLFSCTSTDCPKNQQQWEELLNGTAKHKISFIQSASTDSLSLMWDGKEFSDALPVEKKITMEEAKSGLEGQPSVKDTTIDELTLSAITSGKGSMILYSDQWGVAEAVIRESSEKLLGKDIKIGMDKEEFVKMYFKEYSSCFDAFTSVSFPYGMNENGITYTFKNNKLESVHVINYPD